MISSDALRQMIQVFGVLLERTPFLHVLCIAAIEAGRGVILSVSSSNRASKGIDVHQKGVGPVSDDQLHFPRQMVHTVLRIAGNRHANAGGPRG
jgi:hypothetical protein